MKKSIVILTGLAVSLTVLAPAAFAQSQGTRQAQDAPSRVHYRGDDDRRGHWQRGGHRDEMRSRGRTRMFEEMVETYDTDADGGLTAEELTTARTEQLNSFDTDGSGTLSLQEYEQLWLQAMRERMVDRFQSHDDDGDGQVTAQEFTENVGQMIARGDRNEDGIWNQDDLRRGQRPPAPANPADE